MASSQVYNFFKFVKKSAKKPVDLPQAVLDRCQQLWQTHQQISAYATTSMS